MGTDGLHQDEFLRGDHPKTLFKGSIATPSLEAAIINSKYVNSMPLDRISRDFDANGLHLSKQTMSNWTVWSAERYFAPVYEYMRARQLQAHVNQCDETTLEVIHDGRPAGSKSYMWVHLTGELSPDPRIIVYEYQKTRIAGRMPDVIFRMPSKQSVRAAKKQSKNRLLTKRWYESAPFTNWKVHYGSFLQKNV